MAWWRPACTIVFHDPTLLEPGVLILEDPAAEDGTISGFAEGNEVLIPGGEVSPMPCSPRAR